MNNESFSQFLESVSRGITTRLYTLNKETSFVIDQDVFTRVENIAQELQMAANYFKRKEQNHVKD